MMHAGRGLLCAIPILGASINLWPMSADSGCLRQWPTHVSVRGVLRREVHLGPPGYGETPKTDERDTIVVLVPPASLLVCRDAKDDSASADPISVRRMQLRGIPHSTLEHIGQTVTVFGTLGEASWGWEFTRVVLFADSIPTLERTPRIRVARRSGVSWPAVGFASSIGDTHGQTPR